MGRGRRGGGREVSRGSLLGGAGWGALRDPIPDPILIPIPIPDLILILIPIPIPVPVPRGSPPQNRERG